MRGCVDPREKSVIVPGLLVFLKRARDSISSHGGAAHMSEPQPISGKRIWLGFHVVRSGVDTVGHRYCSRVFGAVEIREIHKSEMGPYLPRVRRKCPPLMGLYPPRTALWSSSQSAISQRHRGFLTVQGGVDPRTLDFLRRLVELFLYMDDRWTGDPGMGRYVLPRWSWLNIRTPANQRSAGGVGISTSCGEVSTRMISLFVPGSSEL